MLHGVSSSSATSGASGGPYSDLVCINYVEASELTRNCGVQKLARHMSNSNIILWGQVPPYSPAYASSNSTVRSLADDCILYQQNYHEYHLMHNDSLLLQKDINSFGPLTAAWLRKFTVSVTL